MGKAPEKAPKTQRDRFEEAARELGGDEDEKTFEQRLKAVAGRISSTGAKKPTKAGGK